MQASHQNSPVTPLTFPFGIAGSALRSLYMVLHRSLLYSSSPGSQSPAVGGEEQGAKSDAGYSVLWAATVLTVTRYASDYRFIGIASTQDAPHVSHKLRLAYKLT